MRTHLFGLIAMMSVGALAACKDDPPPPPPPSADTASTAASGKGKPTKPSAQDRTAVPRISPESMKQYRIETCYFGSMGLLLARDAYLASVGENGPSPTNLPEFGDYPENKPREGADGKDAKEPTDGKPDARKAGPRTPLMGGGRALPFIRHVRACSIAKSLRQPEYADLDPPVAKFEGYVNDLQRLFLDASRYYAREQFKKDDFKRGKSVHDKLMEKLPALDDELAAFTAAMEKWWPTMKPGDEELDEAGKTSLAAVNQAREGIRATMGEEVDAEALGKAIEGLEAKLASLQEVLDKDRTAPHPRVMVPKLTEMIEALKAIQGAGAEVTGLQRYSVSAGMASLIEAHQRGVAQLLRRSAGGMPRTPIRPRLRDDSIRALPRPAVTGRPVVPKAEPH